MNIFLWGAGNTAKKLLRNISEFGKLYSDTILSIVDNNENLWGTVLDDIVVDSPNRILTEQFDMVVICCLDIASVKKQLVESFKVEEDRIIDSNRYYRRCITKSVYMKKYGVNEERVSDKSRMFSKKDKIVVYTAISAGYEALKDPIYPEDNITYVCFTDDRSVTSKIWNMEYYKKTDESDVVVTKKYKLLPHLYFREYDTSIWIDGKYRITGSLQQYIAKYGKSESLLCFPHFLRNCVYDEAAACIYYQKGDKTDIMRQITSYWKEGYPVNNGLLEGGCIVRKHMDGQCIGLMEKWETEIRKFSSRDQISLPYVCWKEHFYPDICDCDINQNEWLELESKRYRNK